MKHYYQKLKKYSALGLLSSGATVSFADIVYTDVNPDVVVHNGTYNIDFNLDGTPELTILENIPNYDWGYINAAGHILASTSGGGYINALNLSYGDTINATGNWALATPTRIYLGYNSNFGYFPGVTDGYFASQFTIAGNTHYGWVRVDVSTNSDTVVIKDYAYDDTPNTPIIAGLGVVYADTALNILVTDISNNINASDIELAFDRAFDESKVAEYRAIIVPSTEVASFTTNDASLLDTNRYQFIPKTGANIVQTLKANLLDKNGDNIIQGRSYKMAILSLPDGLANRQNMTFSSDFALNFDSLQLLPISNLQVIDEGNNSTSTDLLISFEKSPQDDFVEEYRIFAMSESEALSFDKTQAYSITGNRFQSIVPTGVDIYQRLPLTLRSIDGNYLNPDTRYCFFVLCISKLTPPYTIDTLYQQHTCEVFDDVTSINQSMESMRIIHHNKSISLLDATQPIHKLELYNINGGIIASTTDNVLHYNATKGIYFLKIETENNTYLKKVIINE